MINQKSFNDLLISNYRRAIAASRAEQADLLEEDRQLQEAIRLSKMDNKLELTSSPKSSGMSIEDGNLGKKRKAEEDLTEPIAKHPQLNPISLNPSRSRSTGLIKYPHGALRITRTPGRRTAKNCVNLEDVIHKQHLVSACVFSFFIGDMELYDYLPLSDDHDAIPVSNYHMFKSQLVLTPTW